MDQKPTHGGRRPNSGRPKLQPTRVLTYRVPEKKAKKIDKQIRVIINQEK